MITKIEALSAWRDAPTLLLEDDGSSDTDLIQIRNIAGLDPVKASVSTSALGLVDGASYTGSSIETRNIVLTLCPNPDWNEWTHAKLRRLLYLYFSPKRATKLTFYNDDMVPVEISGYVEDISPNLFSKDPEIDVSIICPDPHFTAVDPIVMTGLTDPTETTLVHYEGDVPAGINLTVKEGTGGAAEDITIQMGDPLISRINVLTDVDSATYFEFNSLPLRKYVSSVEVVGGDATNRLSRVHDSDENAMWPILEPGTNELIVIADVGVHNWELTYYERFGGL